MTNIDFSSTLGWRGTTALVLSKYPPLEENKPIANVPLLSGSYWFAALKGIKSATLCITYWPDKTNQSGFAQVTLTEQA